MQKEFCLLKAKRWYKQETKCLMLLMILSSLVLLAIRIPKFQRKYPISYCLLPFYGPWFRISFGLLEKCRLFQSLPRSKNRLTKSKWPDCVKKILAGFKSQWAMPLKCKYSKIPTSSAIINLAASNGNLGIFLIRWLSSPFSASSVKR